MFDKLKQFKDLRDQAKSLQDQLAEEKIEVESDGIKLLMDGNQKIISIKIDSEMSAQQIEEKMPAILNDAIKKAQRAAVQKMQSMGGLGGMNLPM